MSALLDYDTGPLNWVRGEIDTALQAALGRVQAYSVDADLTNALRLAADDAHQVTGALRMVGLEGAATLANALESTLGDINENRLQANDDVLRALRNAIEGLQRWVKDLADGRGTFGEPAGPSLYWTGRSPSPAHSRSRHAPSATRQARSSGNEQDLWVRLAVPLVRSTPRQGQIAQW